MKVRRAQFVAVLLGGCTADLLPGEVVVGVEVPATVRYGAPDSRYGAALGWNGSSLAVAAPGAGEVEVDEVAAAGPASALAWTEAGLAQLGPGGGTVAGEPLAELDGASSIAAQGSVLVAGGGGEVWRVGGWRVPLRGVEALATDGLRVAARVCTEGCSVVLLDAETGTTLEPAATLPVGEGGAVAFTDHGLCAGDPEAADPEGAGGVRCEDGTGLVGDEGEHLGGALGGEAAAGTFDKWTVPPRARIRPLDGGEVLVLERGAEAQPLTLAGDAGVLYIGVPFEAHGGVPSGAVYTVPR